MLPKVIKKTAVEDFSRFSKEFRKQTSVAIVAAFVLLMALVWRDFISELVIHIIDLMDLKGPVYMYRLITAILVTVFAVFGILLASRMHVHASKKN
jgi:hypothetical protein